MPRWSIPAPAWFVAALIPMVGSQIVRLNQHDPAAWIFSDYIGRLAALAVLVAIPSALSVAFRPHERRMPLWRVALWVIGIAAIDIALLIFVTPKIDAAFPATILGTYPRPSGSLYWIDTVLGLALVAYSEEVIFRRCARHVIESRVGDGYLLVVASSLLFGAYHWWTGLGSIVEATIMGVLLMLFLRRAGSLWPVVLAHYLADVLSFA